MALRLLVREFEGFRRSFADQIAAFAASHPEIEVIPEFYPIEQVERMMVTDGPEPWIDVFLCSTDWLPQLIAAGRLVSLSRYLAHDPPPGWPDDWPLSLRGLQSQGDAVYGVAYHDGPEVLLYRRDWLEDSRERQAFARRFGQELKPPETWADFAQVAHHFTRPNEGRFGAVVGAFPDGHNLVYDFLLQLWSRGGEVIQQGRASFHSDAGRKALDYYCDLFDEGLVNPTCRGLDSVRAGAAFAAGEGAIMWNWIGFALTAEAFSSAVRGRVGLAPIPRGEGSAGRHVTLNTYWVLTIPVTSADPDAAWQFIRHLARPEMDRLTALAGGHAVRRSTWRDADIQRRFPPYRMVEALHRQARTLPALPQYPAINAVLNTMMRRALDGVGREGCLQQAAEEVSAILAGRSET